jgi:hypothetical protein
MDFFFITKIIPNLSKRCNFENILGIFKSPNDMKKNLLKSYRKASNVNEKTRKFNCFEMLKET